LDGDFENSEHFLYWQEHGISVIQDKHVLRSQTLDFKRNDNFFEHRRLILSGCYRRQKEADKRDDER
jgi:hypothetical protein